LEVYLLIIQGVQNRTSWGYQLGGLEIEALVKTNESGF
jgi:hypothetical protein